MDTPASRHSAPQLVAICGAKRIQVQACDGDAADRLDVSFSRPSQVGALDPRRAAQNRHDCEAADGNADVGPVSPPANYLLLLDGTVRVQQVLNRVGNRSLSRSAGESCALTTACLMGYEEYQAEGIAETDVEAVAVPRSTFDDLIARSAEFRQFVFTAFSVRITNLLKVIDEVASRASTFGWPRRLDLSDAEGRVALTHQQLASELGTAPRSDQPAIARIPSGASRSRPHAAELVFVAQGPEEPGRCTVKYLCDYVTYIAAQRAYQRLQNRRPTMSCNVGTIDRTFENRSRTSPSEPRLHWPADPVGACWLGPGADRPYQVLPGL